MGEKWDKFLLLMWKNFLLQWRHPKQTLVEILAPVLFTALIVTLRSLVHPVHHAASFYTPFQNKMPSLATFRPNLTWSPDNDVLRKIMDETVDEINNNIGGTAFFKFRHCAVKDSHSLHQYLSNEINMVSVLAGIQFDDSLASITEDDEFPKNLNISLRFPGELRTSLLRQGSWKTDNIFPVYEVNGPRNIKLNEGGLPSYFSEGFLTLQQELSLTLIKRFNPNFSRSSVPINMQRFPYPKFTEDMLISALLIFVGLIFMLSFVYTCINMVKIITSEKEKQLKEIMKIMGLPNWLHWTAWFMKSFIFLLISITLMVALMKIKWYPHSEYTIFTHSNPFVIFLFLTLFSCSMITFCFAISVFFSKANIGATIAGMAWFLCYFPYSFLQGQYNSLSLTTKLSTSLCSNTAMAYGFHLMVSFEAIEEGVQWHNIWKTAHPDDNLAFGYILIMLVIDTFLYLLITLYVEAVFPGDYGVPQPFYFPFTYSYWFGKAKYIDNNEFPEKRADNEFFEEFHNLEIGIKITNLKKSFGKNKIAVKGLDLNMYKDQIMVLLGHNGAGKTTTMSMLTGMFPPTSGTAVIAGYDICKDIESVRKSLGVCPQHNILFDELTVREHLYFFCRLKGVEKNNISREIENYVSMLDLIPKADAISETLSGGMKRKLSVGIALCGDSSVVILDEPTAGMDPSARRALWDLLQSQRLGRTILLSTHFMDEADLLGDRIAIMAAGQLKCCGSSFFLKKKYGAGYHLVMDKLPSCDSRKVTELLKKYIPSIEVSSNIGSELTYVLHNEHSAIFEKMLEEFESCSSSLGIESYGISLTTLEEVFMKVAADQHEEEAITTNEAFINEGFENDYKTKHPFSSEHFVVDDPYQFKSRNFNEKVGELLTGWKLQQNQLMAMFMKKGLSTLRSWILALIQICIPVLFLVLAIVIVRQRSDFSNPAKLMVRLSRFADSKTVITRYTNNLYSKNFMLNLENDNKTLINWERDNMTLKMLEETKKDSRAVHYEYIVGATFHKNNTITAWFNNQPYHSAPLTLQMVMNAVLQTTLNSTDYSIQFYNHPLPYSVSTELAKLLQVNNMGFQIAFNIGFSMAFVSSFYLMFIIRERVCKVKHLQFVSGVNVLSFWLPTFICDFLTYTVTSICTVLTVCIFQEEGYRTFEELGRLFSILLMFGFSMLPMAYLMSYFFDVPSTGYTKMTLINIFTGVSAFLIVYVLKYPKLKLQDVSDILHWVFLIIPHYSLSSGIQNLNEVYTVNKLCSKAVENCVNTKWSRFTNISIPVSICQKLICLVQENCCSTKDYYNWEAPGIGRNLVFSISIAIILIVLLLLIEYKTFEHILNFFQRTRSVAISTELEDDDVQEERMYVTEIVSKGATEIQQHNLLLNNVTKSYGKFLAVNNLNLRVKGQECFGLLGINGAGKTTTFKMLTGDIKLSHGNAWINGFNLKSDIKSIYQQIGYCPQFDALLDDLTCMETLIIFGLLRGITKDESKVMARELSYQFDFHQHINKKVKELSGGNKRKLSTAIAFIGNPQVVYLDEPTTGMDPVTKRYLWDALCKVRDSGKCIVLTSHSLEECEALCTRLAIMVNGTFKCLGSTQHLKSKFSDGYTLTIKAKKGDENQITSTSSLEIIETYVSNHFPGVTVRERHEKLITFYITDRSQKWSKMFGIMERAKQTLDIEDYSLGQCSLEQVSPSSVCSLMFRPCKSDSL